jgi:4-amino-4-deoxy-L-arabinose transferase-like glycosyltransferase
VKGKSFTALLRAHYQLIMVLIGAFLIAGSMGTYTNWDAQLEYQAASSVLTRGFPIVTTGLLINQPPLGFYLDAPIFQAFGLSYNNGVGFITIFGLGCVALVYALGMVLYGKRTALMAAALFSIIPWHVYLSRIFLIDSQCHFFSLLSLTVGILAIRQNSQKKLLLSGVFFALAFLTKLFAVFTLVPLLLMVYVERAGGFRLTLRKALIFLAPSFILQAVWYGGFANQNFFGVYFSSDFTHPELIANPNLLFLPRLLVGSAGWFLFLAGLLSLALVIGYRRLFARTLRLDAVCVGTIAAVLGLDLLFVFGFHLIVPYVSAFKYNYVALPFFCLLAASLVDKSSALIRKAEPKRKIRGLKLLLVGLGLGLLFVSLVESLAFINVWSGFVAFEVDSNGNYFPLNVFSAPAGGSYFQVLHYVAIVVILLSLILPLLLRSSKRRGQPVNEDFIHLRVLKWMSFCGIGKTGGGTPLVL